MTILMAQITYMCGRIRKDTSNNKAINIWVVADNLRRGAASNAVLILEKLLQKK